MTYHTSVVLEVEENTVEALPGLGLSDNDGGVDLLSQLRLSLLDGRDDHVTDTAGGHTVKTSTNTLDGDDVQVSGTGVVGAVHDGTAAVEVSIVDPIARAVSRWRRGETYTGRPRVIFNLPPGAPRLVQVLAHLFNSLLIDPASVLEVFFPSLCY